MKRLIHVLLSALALSPALFPCALSAAEVNFKGGAALRLRHELWHNFYDMSNVTNDDLNYIRIRTSYWGKAIVTGGPTVYARVTNENKIYKYYHNSSYVRGNTSYDINEFVVDSLYMKWKGLAGLPLDLRVGRQDLLTYGEGFLIFDGTPMDASRTNYFNAVKAVLHINPVNDLEFIGVRNDRNERIFPVVYNELEPKQALNSSDEVGLIAYHRSKLSEKLSLEDFYIYKHEDGGSTGYSAKESTIHTAGLFLKYQSGEWTLKGQGAVQTGTYGPDPRRGYGGYLTAERAYKKAAWTPTAGLTYIYLSGDDKGTSRMEAWDPVFSRWAWLSNLYSISMIKESGLSYWTNLKMIRAYVGAVPFKGLKFTLWQNYLFAPQSATGTVIGTRHHRGDLTELVAAYTICPKMVLSFTGEYFKPGSFYKAANRDAAMFFRTELQAKF